MYVAMHTTVYFGLDNTVVVQTTKKQLICVRGVFSKRFRVAFGKHRISRNMSVDMSPRIRNGPQGADGAHVMYVAL